MEEDRIQIAVCDDMKKMTEHMASLIRSIMTKKGVEYDLSTFQSGKDLLDNISEVDLVFLDLEMPDMDGMTTGEEIRKVNEKCIIIVASAREDRIKETFRLNAMRFISKPYDKEEIAEAIDSYLRTYLLGKKKLLVYKNRMPYYILQKEILYIQAYNGSVNIYARNTVFRKEITLNKMNAILDPHIFFKIHKTIIVGLQYVTKYSKDKVYIGNETLPLSRRSSKEFERTFIEFDFKYRG